MAALLLLGALLSTSAVEALTTFKSKCTLPEQPVEYVTAPDSRGTFGIVWICVATVLTCTYNVLHLNVPKRGSGNWKWFWENMLWATATIFVPEVILCKEALDFRRSRRDYARLNNQTKNSWSRVHITYANMGGFYCISRSTWDGSGVSDIDRIRTGYVLKARYIEQAIELGLPRRPPETTRQIKDKSKSNAFSKVITIGQLVFFLVSIIARVKDRVPVTQLELGVLGFALCSMATYIVAFRKPKGVTTQTPIVLNDHAFENILNLVKDSESRHDESRDYEDDGWRIDRQLAAARYKRLQNVENNPLSFKLTSAWILVSLMSLPIGAIHMAGWNLVFPTRIDAWLWRGSAIISTFVLPFGLLVHFLAYSVARCCSTRGCLSEGAFRVLYTLLDYMFVAVCILAYIGARIVLLGEMVRCLFFLPPNAYMSTWTMNIPHIG